MTVSPSTLDVDLSLFRVRRLLHTDFPAVLRIERDLGHDQIDAQTLDHWLDSGRVEAYAACVGNMLVGWARLGLCTQCVQILAVTISPTVARQNEIARRLIRRLQTFHNDPRPLVRIVPERDLGQLLDFRALGFRGELIHDRHGVDWVRMVYRGGA